MIKELAFAGYPVVDMARAREFYESVFDLKPDNVVTGDDGDWTEYNIGKEGCFLLGKHKGWETSLQGPQVAFEVDNFDEVNNRLKEKGAEFVYEPFDTPMCRMSIAVDTEGNKFTVHERKG